MDTIIWDVVLFTCINQIGEKYRANIKYTDEDAKAKFKVLWDKFFIFYLINSLIYN